MNNKDKKGEYNIVVEIPVVMEKANVLFSMDHLAFAGDVPVGISYMHLLSNRFPTKIPYSKIICRQRGVERSAKTIQRHSSRRKVSIRNMAAIVRTGLNKSSMR